MTPTLKIIATNAIEVCVGGITLYFSYETCVAFSSPFGDYRTNKKYSKTTTKHLNLLGVTHFTEIDDTLFKQRLHETFYGEVS